MASVTNAIFAMNIELLFMLLEKRYDRSWQNHAANYSRANGPDYVQEAKKGLFEQIKANLVVKEEFGFPNGVAISAYVRAYIYFRARRGFRKEKAWKKVRAKIAKVEFFNSNDEDFFSSIAAIDVPSLLQTFCSGKSDHTREIVWRFFGESQTQKSIREELGLTRFRVETVIGEFKDFCSRQQ